jgi:hypothetical protein
MDRDAWNRHNWSGGRRVEVEPGKSLIQHRCSRCGRDFVEDGQTGERLAVFVSIFSFKKLPESISKRWLGELCPGGPLPDDVQVRSKQTEIRSAK